MAEGKWAPNWSQGVSVWCDAVHEELANTRYGEKQTLTGVFRFKDKVYHLCTIWQILCNLFALEDPAGYSSKNFWSGRPTSLATDLHELATAWVVPPAGSGQRQFKKWKDRITLGIYVRGEGRGGWEGEVTWIFAKTLNFCKVLVLGAWMLAVSYAPALQRHKHVLCVMPHESMPSYTMHKVRNAPNSYRPGVLCWAVQESQKRNGQSLQLTAHLSCSAQSTGKYAVGEAPTWLGL